MATTPNFNLPIFTVADTAKLDTLLNGITSALDTSLKTTIDALPKGYRADLTNAQRLALTGANLFEGLRVRTTDTKLEWLYSGGTWLLADPGMYLITPTSVSGSGLALVGSEVVATSMPTAGGKIEGIFSSRFRTFEIAMEGTFSGNSAVQVQMSTASATDTTVGAYLNQYIWSVAGGAASTVQNNLQLFAQSATGGTRFTSRLRFTNPATAVATGYLADCSTLSGSSITQTRIAGFHTVSSAYTGITISTTSGASFTGTIRIYGIA